MVTTASGCHLHHKIKISPNQELIARVEEESTVQDGMKVLNIRTGGMAVDITYSKLCTEL
jgi:hypothetical protein